MAAGLPKSLVPIFVAAAIDTKTDPRLVAAGTLLELENMYLLRTGELRLRNGFAALAEAIPVTRTRDNLFAMPGGVIGAISTGSLAPEPAHVRNLQKYIPPGSGVPAGWQYAARKNAFPFPSASATISGIASESSFAISNSIPDLVDGSVAVANGIQLTSWVELATGNMNYTIQKLAGGQSLDGGSLVVASNGRPPICCNGGNGYLCLFYLDTAGTPSLQALNFSSGIYAGASTIVLTGVSAAQPWFDVKPIPGGNLIAVAYRASGGGVSCLVYDPSTQAVTVGPVNTAAADASFCLGWMDNPGGGSVWLATAGATAGVIVRSITAATMAVNGTRAIDATATSNVRQITGHITGPGTYKVLWEVVGSPTYNSFVNLGSWNGSAAASAPLASSFGLYSRTFLANDGLYYFIGAYDSALQPAYSVIGVDVYDPSFPRIFSSACQIFPATGGGRRASQASLANVAAGISGSLVPLARKQQLTTATGIVTGLRGMTMAEVIISSRYYRPRELGGTFFLPGGIVQRDDGVTVEAATVPFFLETPTLASSATGSMTASGSYTYRLVLKRIDATGRITRSAGSIAAPITLGAGDGRVTATFQNPRLLPADWETYYVELYRAGPAAAGAVNFNKIGEAIPPLFSASDTVTFVDSMSDVNAALGEILYSTGNILENFEPPACNLLEVNGGRVWIVSAEDPTILWFSKEYKPGAGIGFNPTLTIRVTGDGYGAITALAAMDGRLVVFKSSAIYVISGDGPTDAGQGSFNPPQAVSLSVGTILPGSVVHTPDGIMFQAAAGIYLLDRGLGLTYIGKPVEKYTLAAGVVDASLVTGQTQARFVMASGRCLVYDYDKKCWSTFTLRVDASTIVACADIPSGWCYARADGVVMQETPGVFADVNTTSTAIIPRIGFPNLDLAGINGYQRVYGIQVLGEYVGDHVLEATVVYDYGRFTEPTRSKVVTAAQPYQYEIKLAAQKCSSFQLTLSASQAAGSGGFRLSGISVEVGLKKGSQIGYRNRTT